MIENGHAPRTRQFPQQALNFPIENGLNLFLVVEVHHPGFETNEIESFPVERQGIGEPRVPNRNDLRRVGTRPPRHARWRWVPIRYRLLRIPGEVIEGGLYMIESCR